MSTTTPAQPLARRRHVWLYGLIGLAVVGTSIVAIKRPWVKTVETVPVERRTLKEEVEVSGTVEALRNVTLKAEATGPIAAVAAAEGTHVAASAPLLTIDPDTARLQWEQAKRNASAQLTAAQTELDGARRALREAESRRQTTIQGLTNDVAKAETALAQVERDAGANAQLVVEGAVSRSSAEQSQTQLRQARIALQAASDGLQRARTDQTEVVAARNRVAAAQTQAANATKQGQVAVDLAANNLRKTTLRAPFAGTVTDWLVNKGDYVAPGVPLGNFQDLDSLVLKLPVDETDLPKMQPGGAVTITFDAYPDEAFAGKIATIGTASQKLKDVMVFPVDVRFDDPKRLIKPGMSGDASVLVSEHQNVLAVPLRAIRRAAGKYYVSVQKDRKVNEVPVEAGIVTLDWLEVRAGLQQGDAVVVAGPEPAKKP
jgi:RND family efflux transporter MFP subunit